MEVEEWGQYSLSPRVGIQAVSWLRLGYKRSPQREGAGGSSKFLLGLEPSQLVLEPVKLPDRDV